jgi:hypothetical protein
LSGGFTFPSTIFFSMTAPSTPRENPRREDRSAGPLIIPAYFMNFGTGFFRFAIALHPFAVQLYHRTYRQN